MMGRGYIGRDETNRTGKWIIQDEYDINVDLMDGYLYGSHRGQDMHRKIIDESFDLIMDDSNDEFNAL